MKLLQRLVGVPKARAQAAALLAAADLKSAEARAAMDELRREPQLAFEALVDAAAMARRDRLDRSIETLHALYTFDLAPLYVKALKDTRSQVALVVARSLAGHTLPDPNALLRLLDEPDALKPAIFTALASQRERLRLDELLRAALRQTGGERVALFEMMATIAGPAAVPELIARLTSKDADYRLGLVRLLGKIGGAEASKALSKMLADPEGRVRLAVLDALARNPTAADPALVALRLADEHVAVQNRAMEILIACGRPEVPQLLAPLLGHESASARRAAIEVLSRVATVDNIKALLGGARDRDWWVRSRSADALGKIGGPKVVQAAMALLKDEDAFIRRTAVEILNASGAGSFDALAAALGDQDWWVRERAIDGLVASNDPRGIKLLRSMLAKPDADEQTRIVLVGALARMNALDAVEDLQKLAAEGSRNVRLAVVAALGKMQGGADAMKSAVATLADDDDEEIRAMATAIQQRVAQPAAPAAEVPAAAPAPPPKPAAPGKPLPTGAGLEGATLGGRYHVLKQLGRGAFGTVLLVEDTIVGEKLAMKFLHPHLALEESIAQRFVKELKLARRITHSGVIRIYDLVRVDDSLAISMEYLPSKPLTDLLKEGPMPIARMCYIAGQVAQGMAAAHAVNVVHRDLKPANVLVGEGDLAKVADFGIAAAVSDEATKLTKTGAAVGTPRYMSPEQIKGSPVTERSDIYSFGTVMYEMLAGRSPLTGGNSMSVMYQHLQGIKDPPSKYAPGIPADLDALVMACLAVDPAKRPATMNEIAAVLAAHKQPAA